MRQVTEVLNQVRGKLRAKDLKKAIAASQAERTIKQQAAAGGAPTDDEDLTKNPFFGGLETVESAVEFQFEGGSSRQLKEVAFLSALAAVATLEKEREFKSSVTFIGHHVMTPEGVEEITSARATFEAELQGV